jgi:NAD(P)-dependent dehydrogenase (short-subunit alcohol dehydrogenase family)
MSGAGKNAIVTGASSGIGKYLAEFLLQEGWAVSGLSRRQPEIHNSRFEWHGCDLSDSSAVVSLARHLRAPIDLVIHNAGVSGGLGPGLEIELAAWRAAFEVNFFAPLSLTKHLLDDCRPNACFIFLSGGGAVTPRPLVGPYAISKLALVKLAEQLALEYPGFRFYAVAPGAHPTQLFEEQQRVVGIAPPPFADLAEVARLLQRLISDVDGRLNGKLVHIRDDLEKLLSVEGGGTVRRVERR